MDFPFQQSMLDLRSFCRTYVNTESSGWRMHANEEELSNERNIILDGMENAPAGNELGYTVCLPDSRHTMQ